MPRSVSLRKLLDEFPHPRRVAARAVRTWKTGLVYLCLVSFSPCSGVWVLPVEYSALDFSGDPACTSLGSTVDTWSTAGFGRNFPIFYVAVNSNPEAFCLHSRGKESVHSRCFWLWLLSALCSHFDAGHYCKSSVHGSLPQFSLRRAAFFGPSMMKNSSSSRARANQTVMLCRHVGSHLVNHCQKQQQHTTNNTQPTTIQSGEAPF